MKKMFLILLFCGLSVVSHAQTVKPVHLSSSAKASVEKSIFGIQTGFLGIWINNEVRLSNSFVLRSELGFAAQIWGMSSEKPGLIYFYALDTGFDRSDFGYLKYACFFYNFTTVSSVHA